MNLRARNRALDTRSPASSTLLFKSFRLRGSSMRVTRFSKPAPTLNEAFQRNPLAPARSTESHAQRPQRVILCLFSAILLTFSPALAHGQGAKTADQKHAPDYTSIVVFGDSLSDVGNVADLAEAKYGFRFPGPLFDYTDGRFTDGADTEPPAESYSGVWIEQLAATFPSKPKVKASLDGGTD